MRDRKVTQKDGGGPCPSKGGDVGEFFRARVWTELHPKITLPSRLVSHHHLANIGGAALTKRHELVELVTNQVLG